MRIIHIYNREKIRELKRLLIQLKNDEEQTTIM